MELRSIRQPYRLNANARLSQSDRSRNVLSAKAARLVGLDKDYTFASAAFRSTV